MKFVVEVTVSILQNHKNQGKSGTWFRVCSLTNPGSQEKKYDISALHTLCRSVHDARALLCGYHSTSEAQEVRGALFGDRVQVDLAARLPADLVELPGESLNREPGGERRVDALRTPVRPHASPGG